MSEPPPQRRRRRQGMPSPDPDVGAQAPRRAPLLAPETTARILWAIPWAALAIFIIVTGGVIFAGAIVVVAAICISEFFGMARSARPFPAVAMLAAAGMI